MAQASGSDHLKQAHLLGWVPTVTNDGPFFDPLTTSASDLSKLLASGKITSTQILNDYYRQILKYNGYLKAVLQLAPGAIDRARALDAERAKGGSFGPLHGIPVLLKDNIGTEPGMKMPTTGCNSSLVESYTNNNAPIVDRLLQAGAIIMGKATLSEMMFFKGTGIRCGWSSLHGQSNNPYIEGGIDPSDGLAGHSSTGGSSSGSGIAVAAGMAPIAIGTETEGSLISPATRQGLWTIKPTLGTVPNSGIMPVSVYFDTAGPFCKTVQDTVDLLSTLNPFNTRQSSEPDLYQAIKGVAGWKDLRVGTVSPERYSYDDTIQVPADDATAQIRSATEDRYESIKKVAAAYHHDVDLPSKEEFNLDGHSAVVDILLADFQKDFDDYMSGTQGSNIRSAVDLAAWNRDHSDIALPQEYPNQALIEGSIAFDIKSNKRRGYMDHVLKLGKSFQDALEKYDINVIIAPGDGKFSLFSAATGFPLCSLPLGCIDYNGRPIGLMAIARTEATLVTLMSAYETSFSPRESPSAFLKHVEDVRSV